MTTTTRKQDEVIAHDLYKNLIDALLEEIRDSFKNTLRGEYSFLVDTFADEFRPEEIYSEDALKAWAVENGFEDDPEAWAIEHGFVKVQS